MSKKIISVANDFTKYPGGRTTKTGSFSGEDFRNNFLIPALKEGQKVIIQFDGTRGYGSSFLEEAFGGLVRSGYTADTIFDLFTFESTRQGVLDSVRKYIKEATAHFESRLPRRSA